MREPETLQDSERDCRVAVNESVTISTCLSVVKLTESSAM